MRIISDFHDYYDCAQGLGQDPTLVYERKPILINLVEWPFPQLTSKTYSSSTSQYYWGTYIIGFCGRIYGAFNLYKNPRNLLDKEEHFYYSMEAITKFYETTCTSKEIISFKENDRRKLRQAKAFGWNDSEFAYKQFFENIDKINAENKFGYLFERNYTPLFVISKKVINHSADSHGNWQKVYEVQVNASLQRYEFYKVFDPYTAYQEIAMFLGRMAKPDKALPNVPDKIMAEVKGFDKFSFRKRKKEKYK